MVQKRPNTRMRTLRQALGGAHMLAFIPILTLSAYWAAGEAALILVAVLLPIGLAALGTFHERPRFKAEQDDATGLMLRDGRSNGPTTQFRTPQSSAFRWPSSLRRSTPSTRSNDDLASQCATLSSAR